MNNINRVKSINANRTAVAITAALMVIAFLIGGTKSLHSLRAESEAVFNKGTASSGPEAFDLKVHLSEYNGLAANVLTVASHYLTEADAAYSELKNSRDAFSNELPGKSYDMLHLRYAALRDASDNLTQIVLAKDGLSSSDRSLLTGNAEDMKSLQTIISRESALYNSGAGEFNEALNSIPASWIKTLGLVKPLPLFNN